MTLPGALAALGLDWRADMGAVREAYRKLSKKYHPDRVLDPGYQAQAHRQFLKIRDAYEYLRKHPQLLRDPGAARPPHSPSGEAQAFRDAEFAELVRRYRERHGVQPSYLADTLAGWLEGGGWFEEWAVSIVVWLLYLGFVVALFLWGLQYAPTN